MEPPQDTDHPLCASNEAIAAGQVRDVVRRLLDDLEVIGMVPPIGVFDCARRVWVVGNGQAPCAHDLPEGFVLVLPGAEHMLCADADGAVDMVELIGRAQDWVIDQLGHGWPEVDGTPANMLTPAQSGGELAWVSAHGHRVPIGGLREQRARLSLLNRPGRRDSAR